MNDPAFKTAAFNMAENTPEYLGKPTTPPISWKVQGDNLAVILADGRKVTGPVFDRYRDKVASANRQVETPAASLPAIEVIPVPERKVVFPVPARKPKTSSPSGKKK